MTQKIGKILELLVKQGRRHLSHDLFQLCIFIYHFNCHFHHHLHHNFHDKFHHYFHH